MTGVVRSAIVAFSCPGRLLGEEQENQDAIPDRRFVGARKESVRISCPNVASASQLTEAASNQRRGELR